MSDTSEIIPEKSPLIQRWKAKLKANGYRVYRALKSYSLIIVLVGLFMVVYFWPRIFINVFPGEAGVLWKRFSGGTVVERPYGEGLQILWPWDRLYVYNIRIQQVSHNFDALSRSGLPINFEVSIRYRPQLADLPMLHKQIGPEYVEKVVKPEVQAHVREVVANYLPEEIYTSEGLLLQIIRQGALAGLERRNIILDNLLIKRMELPKRIREAIEDKLTAEQLSLQYDFLLQKEVKEADRKRIEASGFRDFIGIVKESGQFSEFLNFRGIQASLDLAKSNNSKVVVMGGGDGRVPLVFSMPMEKNSLAGSGESPSEDVISNQPVGTSTTDGMDFMEMLDPATRKVLDQMDYTAKNVPMPAGAETPEKGNDGR
jgi:regulator of protease activity HflC (stomatin/prohibitin superfamily)